MFKEFNEHSMMWLLLTSIVSLIIALLTSFFSASVTTYFTFIATMGQERIKRKHDENLKWANPVIGAVKSLRNRLRNIIEDNAYQVLSADYNQAVSHPDWSISHKYFFDSTIYLFGQYFAWSQMIREEISYELFDSKEQKKFVFDLFWTVSTALSEWGSKNPQNVVQTVGNAGHDSQIFALQQQAVADLFIVREKDQKPRCISYPEFITKMEAEPFKTHTEPLEKLINGLKRDTRRWNRLENTYKGLLSVETECEKLFF